MVPMVKDANEFDVFDPVRWGLPPAVVASLSERLRSFWSRFRHCFKTKTRDTSELGFVYLRGLLTMANKRNFANIARRVINPDNDGQDLQQFVSDSPWSARPVFQQIQTEIALRPELHGGMLTLDDSGDERSGDKSAGAARQYLGREGKVDVGQVGVALGYYKDSIWAMVDAELYLPKAWFDQAHAGLRRRYHIPSKRTFQTKVELALEMIRRAKANGLPFSVVGSDSFYGQVPEFLAALEAEKLVYVVAIPTETLVYLDKPVVGVPEPHPRLRGPSPKREQVFSGKPVKALALITLPDFVLQPVDIRQAERGLLRYECAARRVWTVSKDMKVQERWLLIRREHDGLFSTAFSNAPADTPLLVLAQWRCQQYFAERTFQDAKSEAGWDELVARKYRAWVHHTALDALALWFVAETKLDWTRQHPRDPELTAQLEVAVLPALSMANVREMLQAVMPLKQLSPQEATAIVVKHLVNRSHSTSSRLKAQQRSRGPT